MGHSTHCQLVLSWKPIDLNTHSSVKIWTPHSIMSKSSNSLLNSKTISLFTSEGSINGERW
ncbi:unnamed protein product [Arabidopsis halleri]